MSRDEEQQIPHRRRDMVEAVTGQRPFGYHCNWLRRGPSTLALRRALGYVCHVDYVSRDEPFIELVTTRTSLSCPTPSQ